MGTDLLALVPPWVVKVAIDAIPSLGSARSLLPYSLIILLAALGQASFRYGWRRALYGVSRHVEFGIRNGLFRHLLRLYRSFFQRRPVGNLVSRCTNDLVAVQEFLAYFGLLVVDSSLTIATCLVLMILIDPSLTLWVMLPMPLLSLSFLAFGRLVRNKSLEVQQELGRLTELV